MRTCIVSRAELPEDQLIRFVVGPGGAIAPDLAGRLGGRGVWVCAERAAVTTAVQRNLFAKSLKRQTKPDAGLPDLIDRQLVERLRHALSFAAKAGLVTFGFSKVEAAVERDRIEVLVQAGDAAEDGVERLARKFKAVRAASGRQPLVLRIMGMDDLGLAFARSNVVHVGLSAGGQTQSVVREAERLMRYRRDVQDDRPMVSTMADPYPAAPPTSHTDDEQAVGSTATVTMTGRQSGSSTDIE
jgi:hypothetical protein